MDICKGSREEGLGEEVSHIFQHYETTRMWKIWTWCRISQLYRIKKRLLQSALTCLVIVRPYLSFKWLYGEVRVTKPTKKTSLSIENRELVTLLFISHLILCPKSPEKIKEKCKESFVFYLTTADTRNSEHQHTHTHTLTERVHQRRWQRPPPPPASHNIYTVCSPVGPSPARTLGRSTCSPPPCSWAQTATHIQMNTINSGNQNMTLS